MNAIELLRQEHQGINALFQKFEELSARKNHELKREAYENLRMELELHSSIEEELVYPALRDIESAKAEQLVDEAFMDHERMDELMAEIEKRDFREPKYDELVFRLRSVVEKHVAKEEKDIFRELESALDRDHLETLGIELQAKKRELFAESRPGPSTEPAHPSTFGGAT